MEMLSDRCSRICGDFRGNCFRDNKDQLTCISDMVINKASGIMAIIDTARDSNQCETMEEILQLAERDVNELISWVKDLNAQKNIDGFISNVRALGIMPLIKG